METLKIIAFAILAAITYGILHDMVTAHLAVEYFTIGHPKIIESESPFHLALLWGVIATWWVGLILGILLAITARLGRLPKLSLIELRKPILKLLAVMGIFAVVAGTIGYILSKTKVFYLVPHLAQQIAEDRHHLFLTAGWAHGASYLLGFIGGVVLCALTWRKRKKLSTDLG